jgi:hypothetical protein
VVCDGQVVQTVYAAVPFCGAWAISRLRLPDELGAAYLCRRSGPIRLGGKGVQDRQADYGDASAYFRALASVDRLLISGTDVGQQIRQHANSIEAGAVRAVRLSSSR